MANRLAKEQSPYLLQHANNPVDWYPWGQEAFAAARAAGKPIFLSIGYATCHWCHVMERESFESEGVARVLNDLFVSIKVDREERPDVDRVYMTFVQATTGSGGWPMSVWLTPDLQPFYGGTYFPPTSQYGRPAFVDVLTEIGRAWRDDRLQVVKSAAEIVDRLAAMAQGPERSASGERDRAGQDAAAVSTDRSIPGAAASATRRSSRDRASCCSCCASTNAPATMWRSRWWRRRCGPWRSAACAITSAAVSTATRWTATGGCRISRRCSTTRRSWCWRISKRSRPPAIRSSRRSPKTRCSTCGAT